MLLYISLFILDICISDFNMRSTESKKLRVGCLHGFATNAHFMQHQLKQFKKMFQADLDLVFLEAPFTTDWNFVLDEGVMRVLKGQPRAWINPTLYQQYKYNQQRYSENFLEKIQPLFINEQFDGLIGFSQGTKIVHLLLKLYEEGRISWKGVASVKFCIFISANHYNWESIKISNRKQIDLPSIHILSDSDFLYHKSILSTTQFKDPKVLQHTFGHSMPKIGREQYELIKSFLEEVKINSNKRSNLLRSRL